MGYQQWNTQLAPEKQKTSVRRDAARPSITLRLHKYSPLRIETQTGGASTIELCARLICLLPSFHLTPNEREQPLVARERS